MKIIYKNKTSNEVYINNIDKVKILLEKLSLLLDFDLNLKVYFVKEKNKISAVAAGVIKKDKKWFILYIYDCAFDCNQNNLDTVLFHEFAHLYDIYHASQNEEFNYINDKLYLKSYENLIKRTGFLYWTEFFAHYKCFKNNFSNPNSAETFLQLVKHYKKIVTKKKEIEESILKEAKNIKVIKEQLYDLVELIGEFQYCSAGYIASLSFRKNLYDYSEKHKNKKEFKEVSEIIYNLVKLVFKMIHGTYGKHLGKRLYKIGSYINDKMFSKFNVRMFIYKSTIAYEYVCTKEEIIEK